MKCYLSMLLILLPISNLKINNLNNCSYVVMNMNSNEVLKNNNGNKRQSVASISKIMTAIITIENADLTEIVNVDESINTVDGSSIYLKENETYLLEELLYGLMLRSGNDAAVAIALHVSGSVNEFVELMNKKAKELHMYNTVFHNPSGLDEEDNGNISTCVDMALLTSYAMKNEIFKKIVSSTSYKNNKNVVWVNKNRFLNLYEYATGGKTGYTKNAGRTLVTTSNKNNMDTVVVSFQMNDDFNTHIQLHEDVYKTYKMKKILSKGTYNFKNYKININEDLLIPTNKKEESKLNIETKMNENTFFIKIEKDDFVLTRKYEVEYE